MGSLQLYGRVRSDFTYTCGSFQSACSTGEEIRAHSSGEATMSFCKGIKQPLADLQLLQPEMKETASEPFLWRTSEDLKHVTGRCTTGIDDKTHENMFFISFCKEGVRELRDLVGMAKKNKVKPNIWWHLVARTSSIEQDSCATNKIGKS